MVINQDELCLVSLEKIEPMRIIEFYQQSFPERSISLIKNWRWLYNMEFNSNYYPIAAILNEKVIGFAGIIPINISIDNQIKIASWFIDFKVLEEYQKQGIGGILTLEWMKLSDIQITFCNEISIKIFKKAGWLESNDSFMHIIFIFPFNHPGFVKRLSASTCKTLNIFFSPLAFIYYFLLSSKNTNAKFERLNSTNLNEFFQIITNQEHDNNTITAYHGIEYLEWRIMRSPNRDHYYIYSQDEFCALASLNNNKGKYIDILWVSDINKKKEIKKMIVKLGMYGFRHDYSYLRIFTTNKSLSKFLRYRTFSFIRRPRFAYFSPKENLMKHLAKSKWNWQLIDSDFEYFR